MSVLSKALWYKNRIRAMSPPELVHRAQEMAKRRIDRRFPERFVPAERDYGPLPALPGLREGLLGRQVPESLQAQWQEEYSRAKAGQFYLLGQAWPEHPGAGKWHLDPVSNTSWPGGEHCFSINYRHSETMGDVKYVWELNRLQYLQPVAALACLRSDRAMAEFCLREIDGWIAANPPHFGVNWASGIELGLRVVSILAIHSFIGEHASEAQRARIWGTLEAHGLWLERYPSRFSSANNHLTAEGLGLFALGALCPALPQANRWRIHGWELLCQTAELQILPDGVGAEQTPNYTAVVLEMLLAGLMIARAAQVQVPAFYTERVLLAGEVLRWFTDAAGQQPRIGDDDNARVLGAYARNETYVRSVLGSVAALLDRPDLAPPHEEPHLRQAWFGTAAAPGPSPRGVRVLDAGGYTIGRHATRGEEILLAMDHGYLGYLSIAAHGHADSLSLWLHVGGQPVLVDAGTYLYHSGGAWRKHFRSTQAHNTLCLEDTDSSTMSGPFNWSHKANAHICASEIGADSWWVEAEHDGYKKKFGVMHRRRLRVDTDTGFVVEDRLIGGQGARRAAVNFLLHPALTASLRQGVITVFKEARPYLSIVAEGPLTPAVHAAGSEAGGWYSPTFSIKEPATRLQFAGQMEAEEIHRLRFTLLP